MAIFSVILTFALSYDLPHDFAGKAGQGLHNVLDGVLELGRCRPYT